MPSNPLSKGLGRDNVLLGLNLQLNPAEPLFFFFCIGQECGTALIPSRDPHTPHPSPSNGKRGHRHPLPAEASRPHQGLGQPSRMDSGQEKFNNPGPSSCTKQY